MTLRIILTVVEILLFVGVLAFFLNAIHKHLQHIAGNLTRIADGAKAIEDHCSMVARAPPRSTSCWARPPGTSPPPWSTPKRLVRFTAPRADGGPGALASSVIRDNLVFLLLGLGPAACTPPWAWAWCWSTGCRAWSTSPTGPWPASSPTSSSSCGQRTLAVAFALALAAAAALGLVVHVLVFRPLRGARPGPGGGVGGA